MPRSSPSPPSNQPPTEPDLNGALEDLKELAKKPKKIAPEEVVERGFEQIKAALKQGHSFTDIARVFSKRNVRISAKDLKAQYEARTEKAPKEA